jgi:hypothetical protein
MVARLLGHRRAKQRISPLGEILRISSLSCALLIVIVPPLLLLHVHASTSSRSSRREAGGRLSRPSAAHCPESTAR